MKCKNCGEIYEVEMFEICPYCLTDNKETYGTSIPEVSKLDCTDLRSAVQTTMDFVEEHDDSEIQTELNLILKSEQMEVDVPAIGGSEPQESNMQNFDFELELGTATDWRGCKVEIPGMDSCIGKSVRITDYHGPNTETVVIPQYFQGYPVVSIGEEVFANKPIEEIILPETIRAILRDAFSGCEKLRQINLPDELVYIGDCCFNGSGLEHVAIPALVQNIPFVCFANCKNLSTVNLGASVKTIGNAAFKGSPIRDILFPDSVEFLEGNCFSDTAIKKVIIPKNVKAVNPVAFANTEKISSMKEIEIIFLGADTTVTKSEQFKGFVNVRMVYCLPGSSVEKYAKDNNLMFKLLEDCDFERIRKITVDSENRSFGNLTCDESVCADLDLAEIEELSPRSRHALKRVGIMTIGQLKAYVKSQDLNHIRNLGRKSIDEINQVLNLYDNDRISALQAKILLETDQSEASTENIKIENIPELGGRSRNSLIRSGITTLGQLNAYLEEYDLTSIKHLGARSIFEINEVIKKYYPVTETSTDCSSGKKVLFSDIDPQLFDASVDLLESLGLSTRVIRQLASEGFETIGQLHNVSEKRLLQIVGYHNKDKLLGLEDKLKKDFTAVFEFILEKSSEKDFKIAAMKAQGATLQAIGDKYNLSRERVRQIVKKFYNRLTPLLTTIVSSFTNKKGIVTAQELVDVFDYNVYDDILMYWCKTSTTLEYLDFADAFVLAGESEHFNEERLYAVLEDVIGDAYDFHNGVEELNETLQQNGFHYLDDTDIINLLQKNGYKVYGNYVIKGRQSYGYLCSKIVAKRFPNGIKLYDSEELTLLRKYTYEEYGDIGIADEDRAFSTRLADFLVLSGRGAATAIENIHVENDLLQQIKDYIDGSSEGEFYYSQLFSEFEGLIRMMSNIDNYHFLHGVLRMYYPEEYDYTRDCLRKKGGIYTSEKLSDRMSRFIIEQGRPVHRKELEKKFPGIAGFVLLNTTYESDDIFLWDYNYYYSTTLVKCTSQDKVFLKDLIHDMLEAGNGYCSEWLLYDEVYRLNRSLIDDNNMKVANNLYHYCAKLFKKHFDFKRPHIAKRYLFEELSVKNVVLYLLDYPNKILFSEYDELVKQIKWSDVTAKMCFYDIEDDYIRVSDDKYIKKTLLMLDDVTLFTIENCLEDIIRDGFISLISFDEWDNFPDVGYDWNVYLLHAIIDTYSKRYKIIQPGKIDRRYERGIIVRSDSGVEDYIDLIVSVMKKFNISRMAENELLALLVTNGLAYKLIPKEVYMSEKIIYKDEYFEIV